MQGFTARRKDTNPTQRRSVTFSWLPEAWQTTGSVGMPAVSSVSGLCLHEHSHGSPNRGPIPNGDPGPRIGELNETARPLCKAHLMADRYTDLGNFPCNTKGGK